MVKLLLIDGNILCLSINNNIYYFANYLGHPTVYDSKLNEQVIYNIDLWLHAKTNHSYNLFIIRQMASAFSDGVASVYDGDQVFGLCVKTVKATRDAMLHARFSSDYAKLYEIELMDIVKLENKHGPSLCKQFNDLRGKVGDGDLYNYLCRIWHKCIVANSTYTPIVERLIAKLGMVPASPVYPKTDDIDSELAKYVLTKITSSGLTKFRSASAEIVKNTIKLKLASSSGAVVK